MVENEDDGARSTGDSTLSLPDVVDTSAPDFTVWSEYSARLLVSSDVLGNMLASKAPPCSVVTQKRRGGRVNTGSAAYAVRQSSDGNTGSASVAPPMPRSICRREMSMICRCRFHWMLVV